MTLWEEVAIDFIDLWIPKVNKRKVEFDSLTIIDITSHLVELIKINKKPS